MNDKSSKGCSCRCADTPMDTRRGFITKLALGVVAMHLPLSSATASESDARSARPQVGDRLTYLQKSRRGPFLRPEDMKHAEKQLLAVPVDPETGIVRDGSRFNQIMLTRFDPADLTEQTRNNAGDGVVAYTSICTHDACPISSWDEEAHHYVCPCHQSIFDPKAGGALVSGPAYRSLPALPLTIEDGFLVVAAPFTARVGGGMVR